MTRPLPSILAAPFPPSLSFCTSFADGTLFVLNFEKTIVRIFSFNTQSLLGQDPQVIEEVFALKAELGQVKERLDQILQFTQA